MKYLSFILIPLFSLFASPVFAAGVLPTCTTSGECSAEEIITLVNNIMKWGVSISGALALLMFVIGGGWMIFSAGSQSRVERGKDVITGTTIALIFILGSWLIANFILEALSAEYRLSGDVGSGSNSTIIGCCEIKDTLNTTLLCREQMDQGQCDGEVLTVAGGDTGTVYDTKPCIAVPSCSGLTQ